MIDIVFEGINFTKMIFIVSNEYKEIAKEIGKNMEEVVRLYMQKVCTQEKEE